ncbi:MAG: polysaccharide pyruvyl transferase CsaB [Synergistaceae bacterium]|jgi:polysaccharide pyruvyl transferase CsaB|nr:polysaccharide pyruvyl transferase CsaB [Synergistaceae bacterium]
MSRRYRAALTGYYGFGNLGDELLAEAVIASLLRCGVPRERLVLFSADPEDARRRFGVDAVNRWKPARVSEALGQSETLLFGGGGLFQDATSPRSCFYYWALARLAQLRGAVPWALGQSVGPLSTRAGRFLTRDALKLCRVLQVRDKTSSAVCASLGLSAELGRDPVLSLGGVFGLPEFAPPQKAPVREAASRFLVNLRPCGAGDLPERFARALSAEPDLAPRYAGVALAEEDERLMSDLVGRGCLPPMPIERVRSLEDAVRVWSAASGAAGMRLHFAVLSVMARVPLAAVPYDPKIESFAEACGVPLWRCGALPPPVPAAFPASAGEEARAELDAFCRKGLYKSPSTR